MDFRQAVQSVSNIAQSYRPGLQALDNGHSGFIQGNKSLVKGSVNVDEALKGAYPEESRWDYVIGYEKNGNEIAVWVEVHPASSLHEAETMTKKAKWLKNWLEKDGQALRKMSVKTLYWLAPKGKIVPFLKHSRYYRMLIIANIHLPQRILNLDDPNLRRR